MRYNLFKKEAASSWEVAKEKLMKSTSLNPERIGEDYKKAFPYDYNPEVHFVFEGDLTTPYRIEEDFSITFYNERELVEQGYRVLTDGEFLEGDNIRYIHSPGKFYEWNGTEWTYSAELERVFLNSEIQATEKQIEATQAQVVSREALGMYTTSLEIKITELLEKHSELCYELSKTYKGE
ncbi:hypothetical protein PM10SUCC1_28860 [Propionigenium maris DSM 9537]|uniref:Uncharacterized protein n=1 Tax=Propionigenium maris DSM 9537 TaxID=1123000 RepID=A0A9W6GPF5_9FUSO|nr:hypothetical protein [Propionigenium maris]GLI57372.1 hypothetical protein PM10SUCC1_28860 [Propionigenium maris DSM 9537]